MRPRSHWAPRGFRHLSDDRGAAARFARQGVWPAARVADVLERTGTPQGGDPAHHVGPLPDLAAALKAIEVDAPTTTAGATDGIVTLTAGDATLTASEPGHLTNGSFALARPLVLTG